jgi:hypothetical protein
MNGDETIQIYDIYGRLVKEEIATGQSNKLMLSGLSGGVYLIQILRGKEKIMSTKLIKE